MPIVFPRQVFADDVMLKNTCAGAAEELELTFRRYEGSWVLALPAWSS